MPDHGDDGGELAAMHDLPERSDIRGKVITPGALHTVRDTARLITERKGADYVFTGRANASKTHDTLARIDWERERDGQCDGDVDKAHGRTGQRRIDVLTPGPGTITWPGIRQVARVRRWRESVLPGDAGKSSIETACLITSLGAEAASPRELLAPTEVTGPWRARPPRARHSSRRGRLPDPHRERSDQPRQPEHDRAGRGVRRPPRGRGHHRSHAPPAAHSRGRDPGGLRSATGTRRITPPPPSFFSIENTSRRRRGATRCDGPGHPG